jgi:hypothetical protein
MTTAIASTFATICLMASSLAHANCNAEFVERFTRAERIVDSLRPDKPAQARVSAADGSEYTAGQAQWMKGQLRAALRAYTQGNESGAAATLERVIDRLSSHHHSPSSGQVN